MSFAVTAWRSYSLRPDGPSRCRGVTRFEIDITNAATDTDADIGDLAATAAFWADAIADTTYGAQASALLAKLTEVSSIASDVIWNAPVVQATLLQVLAGAAGAQYQVSRNATSLIPEFTFVTANAPEAWTLHLEMPLESNTDSRAPATYGSF